MNPEQENQLFQDIGEIKGGMRSLLENQREQTMRLNAHGERLRENDRRIYAIWILGPVLLGLMEMARFLGWPK